MKRILEIYLHWDQQSWKTRNIAVIPMLALVFGWMYYHEYKEGNEIHARMIGMFDADALCIAAVNQDTDSCFKDHYHMGKRWHGVRLVEFVSYVNEIRRAIFYC